VPENPELSVVIPILNEESILLGNLTAIAKACDIIVGKGQWKFVLVDNGSTDSTPQILQQIIEMWPLSISVFENKPNYGKALRAGLNASDTPWVKSIDVEQWDIPFFAWAWANRHDYDVLIGSKRADPTLNQQSSYRYFLSWGLNALIQLFFQYPGTDTHGPKLLRMETMKPIIEASQLSRGQFDSEFVLRAVRMGLRIAEAPVVYAEQRPPRNLMLRKILLNIREFNRLRGLLANEPYRNILRMRRFCREDVLNEAAKAETDLSSIMNDKTI
jgi:glycosyltransferase involved in cell wall biosynthesis